MDALGITIAVLLVLGAVLFIGLFVFVSVFIFKQFKKIQREHDEFDKRWNSNAWDRFKK